MFCFVDGAGGDVAVVTFVVFIDAVGVVFVDGEVVVAVEVEVVDVLLLSMFCSCNCCFC